MTKQELFDKFVDFMGRFAEIRAVAALRDGFIMTTPFTVCGSVFLLLANLPIPGYPEFMASLFGADWTAPLNAVAGGTFNILGFIAAATTNYLLNRWWTFQSTNPQVGAEYAKYFLISVVGLGIDTLTVYLLNGKLKWNFYLSKVFAVGAAMVWNFFGNLLFTFA